MAAVSGNVLGGYLRDRRAKLDPTALGFPSVRRRTPGLRREEVAQRANVSATWYTWLEQGRGGAPSADVLDRIARALMLTDAEREHLFLLGLGRSPDVRSRATEDVSPRLQRVLDSLELSLGLVKTSTWDIVAWNRAAAMVLIDYATLAPEQRNILRLIFCNPQVRAKMPNWERHARLVVSTFRLETARAGANERSMALVDDLNRTSPEFAAMWQDNNVSSYGEGVKRIVHPVAGPLAFDYSTFAVDGRPDLGLVVYTPATSADEEGVKMLLRSKSSAD